MKNIKNYIEPSVAFEKIANHFKIWQTENHMPNKVVIGISGGKDSSVVAGIFSRILGSENVIGVSMPCNGQKDIEDVNAVFNVLGIKRIDIDIGNAFNVILEKIANNNIDISYDTKTNLPARLRMSTLYAIAQSVNGIVLNTCNLSEDYVGYATFGGDNLGSYAPIKNLTVTEVIALGDWLGLPYNLTHKTPIDGLQTLSDEEKLGMSYNDIDEYIRENNGTDEIKDKINVLYAKNKFKLDIINIPGPTFMPACFEKN